jgi:hypothetical protein
MLKKARIGICILSEEGAALETLLQADLVVPNIVTALTILNHPTRFGSEPKKIARPWKKYVYPENRSIP